MYGVGGERRLTEWQFDWLHPWGALYSAGYDNHKHGQCDRRRKWFHVATDVGRGSRDVRNARAPGPQGGAIPE